MDKKYNYFMIIFFVSLLFVPSLSYALMLVTKIEGKVNALNKRNDLVVPLFEGSFIDSSLYKRLGGKGSIEALCVSDSSEISVKSGDVLPRHCGNVSQTRNLRSGEANDEPILFFPTPGNVNQLTHVYWGSQRSAKFKIIVKREVGGRMEPIFTAEPDTDTDTDTDTDKIRRRGRYLSYSYAFPDKYIRSEFVKDANLEVIIENINNGRSNLDASGAIPIFFKITQAQQKVKFKLPKHVKSKNIRLLAESLFFINKNLPYEALLTLDKIRDKTFLAQKHFVKAKILHGIAPEYAGSLYLEAIKSDKNATVKRLACSGLQEIVHLNDINFLLKELAKLEKDENTQAFCS